MYNIIKQLKCYFFKMVAYLACEHSAVNIVKQICFLDYGIVSCIHKNIYFYSQKQMNDGND